MRNIASLMAGMILLLNINAKESLEPLKDGKSPQTLEEVWGSYDPTTEPLEVQVFKEWEENGVKMKILRYCIGTFKGKKAWMAAYYGYPEGGKNLPGLVQVHGGGQFASKNPCICNAKRGYATISLNWRAQRFHSFKDLPKNAQTDWGAVEGRQNREARGIQASNKLKYDPVPSGRNEGYFLRTLAARRALTFLQKQPEVDGSRLGIYGHSMGGVISIQTAAIDPRVKAAAPSCAPPLKKEQTLEALTGDPTAYVKKLNCPVMFMNPGNDFHGHIEDIEWIIDKMPSKNYRLTRTPHLNHRDMSSGLVAIPLWFDANLKGTFKYPETPQIFISLEGTPEVRIKPDMSKPINFIDVYYTRDGGLNGFTEVKTRYWRFAKAEKQGDSYVARLPLANVNKPLWVYANVNYKLDNPVAFHSYYYSMRKPVDNFTVSSRLIMKEYKDLQSAGSKAELKKSKTIEGFGKDWEKEWFVFGDDQWPLMSFKMNDPKVDIPPRGKLVLELYSKKPNTLVLGIGDYYNEFKLKGGDETLEIYPFDLQNSKNGAALLDWRTLARPEIFLGPQQRLRNRKDKNGRTLVLGGKWKGPMPEFKKLYWKDVSAQEFDKKRPVPLDEAAKENGKTMLTLSAADQITGGSDARNKTIKSDYKTGLQVHSVSKVSYYLKGKYKQFHASIVPHRQASVTCEVYGDGRKIYDSGKISGKTEPKDVNLDISGVKELELVVTDGGNGWSGDWFMWADAWVK